MKGLRLGAYIRVSTQQQEDGTSFDTQEERIRKFAQDGGAILIEEYFEREIWSGEDLDRPKLDRMRSGVDEGAIDGFIVYDSDRLSRHPVHLLLLKHEIREAGGKLYSVMDDLGDDSDVGDLIAHVKGLASRQERKQIAERTMRGKKRVAQEGRMPCGTGSGLYGFDYDKTLKVRTINETEAPILLMIFQWLAEGVSRDQVAKRLNEQGIPSKRGKKWHALTINRLARTTSVTGFHQYSKQRHRKIKGKIVRTDRPEEDWDDLTDFTPPIIPQELFDRVQERLAQSSIRFRAREPRRPFLLTGFIRCGTCGASVSGASIHKGKYQYYRCKNTCANAQGPAACGEGYIRADDLEDVVWRRLSKAVRNPAVMIADFEQYMNAGQGDLGQREAELRREKNDVQKKQSRLIQLYEVDEIDVDLVKSRIAPLQVRLDDLNARIGGLEEQRKQQDDAAEAGHRIAQYCEELSEKLDGLDVECKRAVLNAFGVRIEATRQRMAIAVEVAPNSTAIGHTLA